MTRKRAVAGAVTVALLTLLGLFPAVSTATASPVTPSRTAADTCVAGEACLYEGSQVVLVYSSAGNATINRAMPSGGGWVWNHGVRYPGLDHIQLTTRVGQATWTICLHYGNQPYTGQPDPTLAYINPGEVVVGWRWRGECVGNEDTWHLV